MVLTRLRDRLRELPRSPLAWVLAVGAVLFFVGIWWGLPATDGWDNDGVAPRDFLGALVLTFTPGKFHTYPPVHSVLLGVLTAPITITALVRSSSLAEADVLREIISVPYMTAICWVARAVTLAMALGIAATLAKIAEELHGKRAGWCAAAAAIANAPLVYYAHTTNLDVPYLFWGCLALLALVRAIARREPKRLRRVALFAALAVGTKDQAYALFVAGVPLALVLWPLLDAWARRERRAIAREVGVAILVGAAAMLVVDAVVFNPSGFRARVGFLVGSASQDFVLYTNDWAGRAAVVKDAVVRFPLYYPLVFAPFALAGVLLHVARTRAPDARGRLVAGLVPLLAIVSFTVAFNCVARRTEDRFLLPQHALLAVYMGVAIEPLVFAMAGVTRVLARVVVAAAFARALYASAGVDVNLLYDPRYDAEAWLAANARPGDTIETYGLNVYLPRFPPQARVVRVGPDPAASRAPLPGVLEVVDTFENAAVRRPRFVVVSQGWAWRYLDDPNAPRPPGHTVPPGQVAAGVDPDGTGFFRGLLDQQRGYHWAHAGVWQSKIWPRLDIHASTSREIWIFERNDGNPF